MKKAFLFVSFLFVLYSCKKSDSGNSSGGYYIKCKIDGVDKAFNYNNMAKIMSLTQGATNVSIIGSAAPAGSSLEGISLGVNFFNGQVLQTNTIYSEDYSGIDYLAAAAYTPNNATYVFASGIYTPTSLPFKLKVTNKTATEMSGTFEGAFYKNVPGGNTTSEHVTITLGEFNVPIK
ncbi:MAG TPA: hypothetical protein VFN30_01575 [Chitinophagaceae bacterium]|nr:hypothetical protein [Chitinophagaceae bacterium]